MSSAKPFKVDKIILSLDESLVDREIILEEKTLLRHAQEQSNLNADWIVVDGWTLEDAVYELQPGEHFAFCEFGAEESDFETPESMYGDTEWPEWHIMVGRVSDDNSVYIYIPVSTMHFSIPLPVSQRSTDILTKASVDVIIKCLEAISVVGGNIR